MPTFMLILSFNNQLPVQEAEKFIIVEYDEYE